MTDEQIERTVQLMLNRLQPPILVIVTAASGYRRLIRQRLADCGYPLTLALADDIADAEAWRTLGQVTTEDGAHAALPARRWQAVLLPFLDYPLAAELVSGNLHSTAAKHLHAVLLSGVPVLALRYHCDPCSELNQLRGAAADSTYARHMQETLSRLAACGITLCTINEMLERLSSPSVPPSADSSPARYITSHDLRHDPALASLPNVQLTDAAIDFLKEKNLPYLRK